MTELRDIEHSLPLRLLRARELAMEQFRPMLRKHGLTDQQWRVLRVLAAEPKGLDAGEIAARAVLLKPSLSRILQFLQQAELVQRRTDPADARRSVIALTKRGLQRYRAVGPDAEALYRNIEGRIGKPELQQLNALLARLAEALETP